MRGGIQVPEPVGSNSLDVQQNKDFLGYCCLCLVDTMKLKLMYLTVVKWWACDRFPLGIKPGGGY